MNPLPSQRGWAPQSGIRVTAESTFVWTSMWRRKCQVQAEIAGINIPLSEHIWTPIARCMDYAAPALRWKLPNISYIYILDYMLWIIKHNYMILYIYITHTHICTSDPLATPPIPSCHGWEALSSGAVLPSALHTINDDWLKAPSMSILQFRFHY